MENVKTIVTGNKVHRPLLDFTITEEDWRKAEVELNETPASRAAALAALKRLLTEQTDFTARTDDRYLLQFLRSRKFDTERSFKLIKDRYMFKKKNPDLFPSPSGIEKVLKANIYNCLPHRDHMGRTIFVVKIVNWDPNEVSFADFAAAGHLLSEYVVENPVTQINGFVDIFDFKGFSLKHFLPFCTSPKRIFLITSLLQDCFPCRFKNGFAVNCPPLTQTFWNISKGFLKEKSRKRIKILPDMTSLHQFIDPSILPEEYGGVMPPSDCTEIAQLILNNEQYVNYDHQFGYKS